MNKRSTTIKRMKAITLSLFLFLGLVAAENLWAQTAIMPLGDSITYDNNSGDVLNPRPTGERTGYRQPLWLDLLSAGYNVDFVGSLAAGQTANPPFDYDNEGHSGFRADQIRDNIFDGPGGGNWLINNPADVVLLHIGTNDISDNQSNAAIAAEIGQILDEIDQYSPDVWVILARIINRSPLDGTTTSLNDEIQVRADARIAAGDKIIVVNMENKLIYSIDQTDPYSSGDMWDELHPNVSGYDKMATAWFDDGLFLILPVADAGLDDNVNEGDPVQLDGTFSNVPQVQNGNFLVEWIQTAGLAVNLDNPNILTPTFTAPQVGVIGAALQFQLTISDADNANITDQDTVNVTVNDTAVINTVSNGGGGGGAAVLSRRCRACSINSMTFRQSGTNGA